MITLQQCFLLCITVCSGSFSCLVILCELFTCTRCDMPNQLIEIRNVTVITFIIESKTRVDCDTKTLDYNCYTIENCYFVYWLNSMKWELTGLLEEGCNTCRGRFFVPPPVASQLIFLSPRWLFSQTNSMTFNHNKTLIIHCLQKYIRLSFVIMT